MNTLTSIKHFATCPRGLETVLSEELAALGAQAIEAVPGGVHFTGDARLTAKANLYCRSASRILVRLATRSYRSEDDIYRAALAVPWSDWFRLGDTFRVHVTAINAAIRSSEFITLRIKDAVCDHFRQKTSGRRPSVETANPDQRIHAFIERSAVTFYMDASGEALFKRGHRESTGEAPLRENLAAGLLLLAGWKPSETLFDPMCGSGTFLIEAAMMAQNRAPGINRRFAAERWLTSSADVWQAERQAARAAETPDADFRIVGADNDPRAIAIARQHLEQQRLADRIPLQVADARTVTAPADTGVWLTNPPYGVRLSDQEALAALYPQLGDHLKQQFAGWRAYFFTADLRLPKLLGLKAQRRVPLFNGNLECRLYEYLLRAGSWRQSTETSE